MTIKDVAKVQWTITTIDITARSNGRYLHRWIIGKKAKEHQPTKIRWDAAAGRISLFPVKINSHNDAKGNGQPEMGWGLKEEAIPTELLEAEITHLNMECHDGIEYEVRVDVELSDLTAKAIKATWMPEIEEARYEH